MASRLKILNILQYGQALTAFTARRPQPRLPVRLTLRASSRRPVSLQKLLIAVGVPVNPDNPHPVRIIHMHRPAPPSALASTASV